MRVLITGGDGFIGSYLIPKLLEKGMEIVVFDADKGESQSPYPVAYDDSVARQEIGWESQYPIEAAVEEHIEIVSGKEQDIAGVRFQCSAFNPG